MMNQTSKSLNAEASDAAKNAIQASSRALESTRHLASPAVEQAGEKARDLRYSVSDATAAAQRQLGRYAHATRIHVSDQPVKSALIAAAIGAAVAALVLAIRRNRRDYY